MRPQPMRRPGDCVATALAAMLDIDELDLPHTGIWDSELSWRQLRSALAARGWRITYSEWTGSDTDTLADVLALPYEDEIEAALIWLVSVTHPSFIMGGEQVNHVVVVRGHEVLFDPGSDVLERPPAGELLMRATFMLAPLDPSAFTFQAPSTVVSEDNKGSLS